MKVQAQTPILTERLQLLAPEPRWAEAVLDFYERNRGHFAPWEPSHPADFYTARHHQDRLAASAESFAAGQAYAYWLQRRGRQAGGSEAARIVGQIHFSGVVRGPFHNAMLGYSLDGAEQGRGLMHEALSAGIDEMFSERVMLHRLQANVRPENRRSLAVLVRLGFRAEGLARQYLYIDGQWRHHLITALINPGFEPPPAG